MAGNKIFSKFATAVILCFVSIACAGIAPKKTAQTAATASQPVEAIAYGEVISPDNSDYLLIPVGSSVGGVMRKYGGSGGGTLFNLSNSDKNNNFLSYNIIFHNKKNAATHLLLPENALITSFQYINDEDAKGKPKNKYIFLELIPNDTTGEGVVDREDAVVGYLADISGKNLKQITPENAKLLNWYLDAKGGFMLLRIRKDSDGDKRYTEKDETSFLRVSLAKPALGGDILSDALRKQLGKRLEK